MTNRTLLAVDAVGPDGLTVGGVVTSERTEDDRVLTGSNLEQMRRWLARVMVLVEPGRWTCCLVNRDPA